MAMVRGKNPEHDLRLRYRKVFWICTSINFVIHTMIAVFFPEFNVRAAAQKKDQIIINMETSRRRGRSSVHLRHLGLRADQKAAAGVLRRYDDDMNGRLDVHEFNELVHELLRHEPVGVDVRRVFEDFDRNRNGYLEARELREALRALGFEADASATLAVLRQFDGDLNRRLDLHEWRALVWELQRALDLLEQYAAGQTAELAWQTAPRSLDGLLQLRRDAVDQARLITPDCAPDYA